MNNVHNMSNIHILKKGGRYEKSLNFRRAEDTYRFFRDALSPWERQLSSRTFNKVFMLVFEIL
jgi:hypothetical protein